LPFSLHPNAQSETQQHDNSTTTVIGVEGEDIGDVDVDQQPGEPSVTTNLTPSLLPANDIGFLLASVHGALVPSDRYRLLISKFQPPIPEAEAVKNSDGRRFRPEWLVDARYSSWLFYTQYGGGGAICKQCILSISSAGEYSLRGRADRAAFITAPFTTWKNFTKIASGHMESVAHKDAVLLNDEFKESFEKGGIDTKLSAVSEMMRKRNRAVMTSIVKTVMFCGKRGLALRGDEADEGNFYELLQFHADAGDDVIAKHLKEMKGNAKYTSPQIQNEILLTATNSIVDEIVAEANSSGYIAILCDESADISG
jgi:hypothetical protein